MPSPFPGMDPWLESHWGDVHQRIVLYAADQLQEKLPSSLRARVEERVFLQSADEIIRTIAPDVRIQERATSFLPTESGPYELESDDGGIATLTDARPFVLRIPPREHDPVTESYLEIRESGAGGRVITTIEVLSLSNKYGGADLSKRRQGRSLYEQKVDELSQAGVSLVEINLLRSGPRSLLVSDSAIPPRLRTPYFTTVVRGWNWDEQQCELYDMPLREKLPPIQIPLREHERDVTLDLQSLIEQCYDRGGYDDLNYSNAPVPPLAAEDQEWADKLLRERGLRS